MKYLYTFLLSIMLISCSRISENVHYMTIEYDNRTEHTVSIHIDDACSFFTGQSLKLEGMTKKAIKASSDGIIPFELHKITISVDGNAGTTYTDTEGSSDRNPCDARNYKVNESGGQVTYTYVFTESDF